MHYFIDVLRIIFSFNFFESALSPLSSRRKWPSHTHILCMVDCQPWTTQICAMSDLVIKLSQATLWLMAAGFWWGCRCLTGTTVRLRPSVWFQACVCFAGKIPSNKTPPPVFLPPCQPNRDKNAQHSHTQTYQN